eukprot:scaffold263983_cov35-Tisochrysis_lutea.AAC.1
MWRGPGGTGPVTKNGSRSPLLMQKLRELWYLLDSQDIELRALYIRMYDNVICHRRQSVRTRTPLRR